MRILVACECSGAVRDAFISRGHDAISCDLVDTRRPGPHIKGDVLRVLHEPWDLVIAFPPCTDLCVSGARWFAQKRADGRQQASIEFFMAFTRLTCPWAIENPVGVMSSHYRKPDQIIQPWQFGEDASKATCLWLHKLPKLIPTNIIPPTNGRYANQTPSGQNKLGPSADRAELRAITYPGIAAAMAEQWSKGGSHD
jgi:hypothetical protein